MADIDKLFDIDISSGLGLWDETINTFYSKVMDLDVVSAAAGDRGVFAGGYNGSYLNTIEYIAFSSLMNAVDFGDTTTGENP